MKTREGTNGARQENQARPIILGAEVPHDVGFEGETACMIVREEALQSVGKGVVGRSVSTFFRVKAREQSRKMLRVLLINF